MHGQKHRSDQADAGRQPVHVVQKIHRVADARKPDDGDQRVSGRERSVDVGAGQREHQKRPDRQRRHELGDRRELQPVVENADDKHGKRADGTGIHSTGGPTRSARKTIAGKPDNRPGGNRHAAHRGCRRRMPAVGAGRDDRSACGAARRRTTAPPARLRRRRHDEHNRQDGQHSGLTACGACQRSGLLTRMHDERPSAGECRRRLYPVRPTHRAAAAGVGRARAGKSDTRPSDR